MNRKNFFITLALVIVATAVAFVSCKKDSENAPNRKGYTVRQATDIRQLEDPAAYILDFKKNLTESKSDEAYGLEDAAWHLACLANLEFCNVNVKLDDFLFDTVEMKVNVSDGTVLTGDLREAYERMRTEILQFKKGFSHTDQNLYYVNLSINANGDARIAIMCSYTTNSKYIWDHYWYYDDMQDAYTACDNYFSGDSIYTWNNTAARELKRVLNIIEHHESHIPTPSGIQWVFFPTRTHSFDYHSQDPYYSTFLENSRLFAKRTQNQSYEHNLDPLELCYCLDSYLGLGYEFMNDNQYLYEHVLNWNVIPRNEHTTLKWWTHYHELYVEYGQLIMANPPGPNDD